MNTITDSKKNLEKSKNKYFEASKSASDYEKKVVKVLDDKELTLEEKIKSNENLVKLRSVAESNCHIYKQELVKIIIDNFY